MKLLTDLLAFLPLPFISVSPWFDLVGDSVQKPFAVKPVGIESWNNTVPASYIPTVPRWVTYWDEWISGQTSLPPASSLKGFNVLSVQTPNVSISKVARTVFFHGTDGSPIGPADQVQQWVWLTDSQRASIKSQYNTAGIALMVSAFGATEEPTTSGYNAVTLAKSMAAFVKKYNLDGIDVDYEDFAAINAANGKAEQWLITFTQTLRAELPAGKYIITHAPVAPWFSPIYSAGAYRKVHSAAGSLIDWYNVQFYNQAEYLTCPGLLTKSSSTFPKSSVFQIASSAGVPLNKIVIGKPAAAKDAANGYMSTSLLASCLQQAKSKGWNAGAMFWQYPRATSTWITAVRALSWPVGGPAKRAVTTEDGSSVENSASACSACQSVKSWSTAITYAQGAIVSYDDYLYNAQWQTQGDVPGATGVIAWLKGPSC